MITQCGLWNNGRAEGRTSRGCGEVPVPRRRRLGRNPDRGQRPTTGRGTVRVLACPVSPQRHLRKAHFGPRRRCCSGPALGQLPPRLLGPQPSERIDETRRSRARARFRDRGCRRLGRRSCGRRPRPRRGTGPYAAERVTQGVLASCRYPLRLGAAGLSACAARGDVGCRGLRIIIYIINDLRGICGSPQGRGRFVATAGCIGARSRTIRANEVRPAAHLRRAVPAKAGVPNGPCRPEPQRPSPYFHARRGPPGPKPPGTGGLWGSPDGPAFGLTAPIDALNLLGCHPVSMGYVGCQFGRPSPGFSLHLGGSLVGARRRR